MDKDNSHINLGLSLKELELLLKNSNNPDLLKQYEEKLENCDLSKSAIELTDEDNLRAIKNITESVTDKYPYQKTGGFNKGLVAGIITIVILIGVGTFFLSDESPITKSNQPIISDKAETKNTLNETLGNQETDQAIIIKSPNSETKSFLERGKPIEETDSESALKPEENEEDTVNQNLNLDDKKLDLDGTVSKEDEIKRSQQKEEGKVEFVAVKEERQVRNITTTESVANKFKDLDYGLSDLVSYSGGKKELEKHLFEKLKDKVKDTDVPKRNSSIVFKFNVTAKGKVQEVNVLSLVSPELEQIIKETTLNLINWNKGKKRIPRDYTVYITFK